MEGTTAKNPSIANWPNAKFCGYTAYDREYSGYTSFLRTPEKLGRGNGDFDPHCAYNLVLL